MRNDYIEVTADDVFARHPSALLELFVVLQQNPRHSRRARATIRLLGRKLWLIDEEFRQNPRHHRLFLEILRAPAGVTHELRRMNLYGVLGRYIPAFGRIVGRMQYDLFHAYTVDAHTLFVVQQPAPAGDAEVRPRISGARRRSARSLPKPEIAYLAALFHDIAKGRGGDHSELGAVDAEAFCLEQGLSRYDARLVAWLVRNHLMLSVTAQKKDISDPEVIRDFARLVGDQTHLDYLYVLTVADVRGTNPKLWNTWKASLFEEFYERTKRALRRGLESAVDQEELVAETQAAARDVLQRAGGSARDRTRSGAASPTLISCVTPPNEIAWHTALLAEREPDDTIAAGRRAPDDRAWRHAVLAYTPHRQHSFARTTAVLDQMGLNIVDARITPTRRRLQPRDVSRARGHGRSRSPIGDRIHEIERQLRRCLQSPGARRPPSRVVRRARCACSTTPTQVTFTRDDTTTHDPRTDRRRPAGPAVRGRQGVHERAGRHPRRKIMTVGERAEDVFYVSDEKWPPAQRRGRRSACNRNWWRRSTGANARSLTPA